MSKNRWISEWERQMHPFIWWHIGNTWFSDRTFKKRAVPSFLFSKKTTANLYLHVNIFKNGEDLIKLITKNSNFLRKYRLEMKKEADKITAFSKKLLKLDYKKLSKEQLCRLIDEYSKLYKQHGVVAIRSFNRIGMETLTEFLQKKVPKEKVQLYLSVLTFPSRSSIFEKEREELKKITKLIKSNKNFVKLFSASPKEIKSKLKAYLSLNKKLDQHVKKYSFIVCGYVDEDPLNKDDFIRKIQANIKRGKVKKEQPKISRNQLLVKLKAPIEIRRISEALSEFTYYKDSIRSYYNILHFSAIPLFKECANRLNITLTQLKMLMPPEIKAFLYCGKADKKLINHRYKLCVVHFEGKGIEVLAGQKAKKFLKENLPSIDKSSVRIIKGVCANKGVVTGKVKIVKTAKDVSKNDKDFILVTPMTTPELVPVIHNAKAIVTDEGGVTCHAAIVARELNKPCVIGTQIATKTLKNGDLVEVDADKGIVRKL